MAQDTSMTENTVPEVGDMLLSKKTRHFQTKPILLLIIAAVMILVIALMLSQRAKPTQLADNNDELTEYTPAAPTRQIVESQKDAINNTRRLVDDSNNAITLPPDIDENASSAKKDTQLPPPPQKIAITPSTNNAYAGDPLYTQRAAARQQYLDSVKQSYMAKPSADGNWPQAIQQAGSKISDARKTNDRSDIKSPTERLNELLTQNKNTGATQHITPSAKEQFFNSGSSGKGYLSNTRTAPISPYTLPSGTMIPCTMISGINSDLPGNMTASVTENVYDWAKPHICLIPQGAKLFGTYDSNIDFAQKRIQIQWSRLIFPDGSVIDLEGMPGVDRRGFAGLKDKHYAHYGRMLTAALLTTAISLVPEWIEQKDNETTYITSSSGQVYVIPNGNSNEFRQTAGAAAAQALGQVGNKFFDKALNVQPTILIRPGTRFNVQVNADIPFYRAW